MPEPINESVPIGEAQDLGNGRYKVVAITAGKGSSGRYPADTLREAANRNLLARGTHSFWDHDTTSGRHERPERSVRDLVGVFTSDATWDEGLQGLVAEYQVFSPYRQLFSELAEHVGLSIVGDGDVVMENGERVVKSLEHIHSVDLVTRAGRGGKVLSLLESARPGFDADDMAATTGVPNDATQDPPAVVAEASPTDTIKEALVAELSEAEAAALRFSVTEAEAARDAALAEAATARAALADATARQSARPVVAAKVAESKTLGARTQQRLVESIVTALPVADGKIADDALTTAVESAVTAAETEIADYARATPAPLFGVVGSTQESAATSGTQITESDIDKAAGSAFGRTGA